MDITILATGSFADVARDTAETFGWNWQLFLSQVISFSIVAFLLRRFASSRSSEYWKSGGVRIEEGLLNAEKIKQELAEAERRYA